MAHAKEKRDDKKDGGASEEEKDGMASVKHFLSVENGSDV